MFVRPVELLSWPTLSDPASERHVADVHAKDDVWLPMVTTKVPLADEEAEK
jgi:hypothetical protein